MKSATTGQVRTWLAENGGAGKRGRIKSSDAERFNAAHKGKFAFTAQSEADLRHITVAGVVSVDKAGRKVTKSVTLPARDARMLVGVPTNQKGRISYATVASALSAQNANDVADTFTK